MRPATLPTKPNRHLVLYTVLEKYVGQVPTYYAAVRLELRNSNPDP